MSESENGEDFDWEMDFRPAMALVEQNYCAGKFEWVPIKQGIAWHFLEALPPLEFNGGDSFAVGEPYTHANDGRAVYLCIRGLASTGLRAKPENAVVSILRAVSDETKMAYACYMTRPQFRAALREPIAL
jgi:hypothetical protein